MAKPKPDAVTPDVGIEIDYSGIKQEPVGIGKSRWKPPKHVYFGPKDPDTGEMLPEPEYVHQDYPRMIYKRDGGKVRALVVNDDEELETAKIEGYVLSLLELNVVTAPTFEQARAAQLRREAAESAQ